MRSAFGDKVIVAGWPLGLGDAHSCPPEKIPVNHSSFVYLLLFFLVLCLCFKNSYYKRINLLKKQKKNSCLLLLNLLQHCFKTSTCMLWFFFQLNWHMCTILLWCMLCARVNRPDFWFLYCWTLHPNTFNSSSFTGLLHLILSC